LVCDKQLMMCRWYWSNGRIVRG